MKWFHVHVYYTLAPAKRDTAERLWNLIKSEMCEFHFVGDMVDRPVGPHPTPQFEAHFTAESLWPVVAKLYETREGLSVLVHPVTPNDHEDHFEDAIWLGEPLALDATVLDPPGQNKAFARLAKTQFLTRD